MLQITETAVHLTRGDACDLEVIIHDLEGNIYTLAAGDLLLFTLKKNCITEDIIIQKDITSDSTIHLSHDDTDTLLYDAYKFDVQLTMANGKVYTVITPHDFIIEKEVTFNVSV